MAGTEDRPKPAHQPGTRKGEDVVDQEGKEPGRHGEETTGAGRPAGKSDARRSTAINPDSEDPIDPQSPKLPPS